MSFVVVPAVDIAGGRCVRLLQGSFGTETVYSDDPIAVAVGLCRAGARRLHIVDLDGAKTGAPANRELVLEAVRRSTCPVQAGGGLRSADDVEEVLAAGAQVAVLGTVALEDRAELGRACRRFVGRVAVSLDARGGELASRGWTVGTGIPVLEALEAFESAGVALFVYTDVGRDGTMSGPDMKGLLRVADATARPVIASGGIATLQDLRAVAALHGRGVAGAIVGRALYEGAFQVADANRVADEASSGLVSAARGNDGGMNERAGDASSEDTGLPQPGTDEPADSDVPERRDPTSGPGNVSVDEPTQPALDDER